MLTTESPRHIDPVKSPYRREGVAVLSGIGVLILRILAPLFPVISNGNTYTLGQIHGVCSSTVGVIAQAIDSADAQKCGYVSTAYTLMNIAVIAAVVLIVAGIARIYIKSREAK